ncbi:unnamed protein product [Rotaria sp. Silwood2]|nr:unnamed protein product [Rotaria sp. Silwood2]
MLSTNQQIDALEISLLVFLSYIIILNIVVSISLYVSFEFICLLQSKWIDWDIKIYYELNNVQAQACTTTLNEELGQIENIFSDKTGTLIQNIMTFNKCSIREKLYDYVTDEAGNEIQDTEKLKAIEFDEKEKDDYFQWYNQILLDAIKNNDKDKFVTEDFRTLYLAYRELNESEYREWSEKMNQANTSMEKREEKVKDAYEQIENHFKLIGATAIEDKLQDDILQYIEFLARADIKIWVLTGDKIGQALRYALENKLKMKFLERGTMCKAVVCCRVTLLQKAQVVELVMQNEKKITLAIGDGANDVSMIQKFFFFSTSMEKREEKVKDSYEQIENHLKLNGATAIEDKLQDGVPQCIERLARAGIKIWVLTGDKIETAYNIGLSCCLLKNDMESFFIEEENEDGVEKKLKEVRNKMITKIEQLFDVHIDNKDKRLDWKD